MRKALATTAASLALVAGVAVAHAQEATEPQTELPWTLGEFLTVYPEAEIELFNEIDTAGDGMITEEELQAAIDAGLIEDPHG